MYGKIFEQIYDSTVAEDWKALVTFQQLIVLCGSDGVIDRTPESISRRTNIPIEIIKEGIAALEAPDPRSRNKEEGGRRIVRIDAHRDWGWKIVNHASYRRMISLEEKREADRIRLAEKRASEKSNDSASVAECRIVSQVSQSVADVAHTDADAYTEAIKKTPNGVLSAGPVPFAEFVQFYRARCVPPMPDIQALSEQRRKTIRARWAEHPNLDFWAAYFAKAAQSDFLTGRRETSNGPFFASFDWLLGPKNFVKVLEGNYDNRREESGLDALIKKAEREEKASFGTKARAGVGGF